jgi:O-acetylserine/cysteine efflux transporter
MWAALFGFGGVTIVFWRQIDVGGSAAGMASVAAAAVLSSVGPIALQRGPKQSAVGANTVGTLVAVPFALVASLALREAHPFPSNPSQFGAILYLAIASSIVAFGLFTWLVNRWRASSVAFLGVIVPVTALILGVAFRRETFSPDSLAGACVVLVAVVVAIRSESPGHAAVARIPPSKPPSPVVACESCAD